jgi:hypothetical protein
LHSVGPLYGRVTLILPTCVRISETTSVANYLIVQLKVGHSMRFRAFDKSVNTCSNTLRSASASL